MSTTVVTYPIVAAVKNAEHILGPNRQWRAVNDMQQRFLVDFFDPCRNEVERIPEIESIASFSCDEINLFLREHGFTIQLRPWEPPNFGVASVLDVLVEWLQKGEVEIVKTDDGLEYPGVRISGSVQFFRAPGHANPIAGLETKSSDRIYVTMLDRPPEDFGLIAKAQAFSRHWQRSGEFGGLIFPMVKLDQEVNIEWLIRMATIGDDDLPAIITQAKQQTKLKMNEMGARAESAAAIEVSRGGAAPKPDHVINRPFLIWFERERLSRPLFVGHITQEDWRNPGDLMAE